MPGPGISVAGPHLAGDLAGRIVGERLGEVVGGAGEVVGVAGEARDGVVGIAGGRAVAEGQGGAAVETVGGIEPARTVLALPVPRGPGGARRAAGTMKRGGRLRQLTIVSPEFGVPGISVSGIRPALMSRNMPKLPSPVR